MGQSEGERLNFVENVLRLVGMRDGGMGEKLVEMTSRKHEEKI